MIHTHSLRVYYEDTDLAGIVYYANYLKFIERGRTEVLRDLNIDQMALREDLGIVFAVRRVEADYLSAAKMDDELEVRTEVSELGKARIVMSQDIYRDQTHLFSAKVTLACLKENGKPSRIPADVAEILSR